MLDVLRIVFLSMPDRLAIADPDSPCRRVSKIMAMLFQFAHCHSSLEVSVMTCRRTSGGARKTGSKTLPWENSKGTSEEC